MRATTTDTELEGVWRAWLEERNVRSFRLLGALSIGFFAGFWLLDMVFIPEELIWTFGGVRLVACLWAATILFTARSPWARRHQYALGAITVHVYFIAIMVMVLLLGGSTSIYYAGANLTNIGTGLLLLFGGRRAIFVYGGTVLIWLVVVAFATEAGELLVAIGHSFFVAGTAILVVAGQFSFHSSLFAQVRANHAVELTKSSLEQAHEDLKRLDRFKSEVFANITHELKTPLAMILSPLELMLTGELGSFTEAQANALKSMFRNGMKLLKMVGDILTLSRLEESRIRLKVDRHDLAEYLRSLVAQIEPLVDRKEIRVEFQANAETIPVYCDLEQMERVFVNLLSNAAKYSPEGSAIRLGLEDEGDTALVSVSDEGPGFPAEEAQRIFERFVQLDGSSTRRYQGAGIGLSLARELVELHGGTIWAESEPGTGATFKVRLVKDLEHFAPEALDRRTTPRDVSRGRRASDRSIAEWSLQLTNREDYRLLQIAEATERRVVQRDPEESARAYTVLVVEDMPDVIRVVHLTLRQHFRVIAAEDGLKGLEMATEFLPDLIITDLMMPGIDGLELVKRLRGDTRTSHVPIIMLTARGELEDRLAGLETGVNAYLAKPFSPRELLGTVRNLLDLGEQTADLILTQRMDSLETVAGGIAHEINNPLNYIKNSLTLVRTDLRAVVTLVDAAATRPLTEEESTKLEHIGARVNKMFDTAEAGLKRIAATVDTIRSYSREGFVRAMRTHDVYAAVGEVIAIIHPAIGRDVKVTTELEGDGTILCVPEELNQVLTNIIQNAIEAAPDGTGEVTIRGVRENSDLVISIRDNGPGMTPEVRDRIFTPFFTTKGPGRGSGMGLTITWRVVKSLGGSIQVQSEPGGGTEFIIRIPTRQSGIYRAVRA